MVFVTKNDFDDSGICCWESEESSESSSSISSTSCQSCDVRKSNNNNNNPTNDFDKCVYKSKTTKYRNNFNIAPISTITTTATTKLLNVKDLVGNSKEFRIDHNKCDLRIIGNNNKIRIRNNTGYIQLIGNNTNLKIVHNDGLIKYTGNNGYICLGHESKQQFVDYIGCNGKLKVKTTLTPKSHDENHSNSTTTSSSRCACNNVNLAMAAYTCCQCVGKSHNSGNAKIHTNTATKMPAAINQSAKVNMLKSASFGDALNESNDWLQFSEMLNGTNWQNLSSLPNLKETSEVEELKKNKKCSCKCKCNQNNKNKSSNSSNKTMRSTQQPQQQNNFNVRSHPTAANIAINNSVNVNIKM